MRGKRKKPDYDEMVAREKHYAKAAALAAGAGKLLTEWWQNWGNETTIEVALSLLEQARAEQRLGSSNGASTEAEKPAGGKA